MTFVLLWVGFPVCPNPHLVIEQPSRQRAGGSPGFEHFIYAVTLNAGWLKLSEKRYIVENGTIGIMKKYTLRGWTDPQSFWRNDSVSSFRLIGYAKCMSYWPSGAFQFKSFGVTAPGWQSQSDWNLTEQDEINEAWPPRGLLTPVCLSPSSRTCNITPRLVTPQLWARLVTNQFHLDGSQKRMVSARVNLLWCLWEIVAWLVFTTCYLENDVAINKVCHY